MEKETTEKITKRHCCHIGCEDEATHIIQYSEGIEDYTEMCKSHLSEYLPDDKEVRVIPVEIND